MKLGEALVLAVCTMLLFLCLAGSGMAQEPYRIGYSTGAEIHAEARDRLKVVYERAGLPVEFVPLPQKRSLMSADEGVLDGEAGRIPGTERHYTNLRRVDVKLVDLIGAAYVMEGWTVGGYREVLLDAARLGLVRGVLWAEKLVGDRCSDKVKDYKTLFDMLLEGRVGIVLASKSSAEAVFRSDEARYRSIRMLKPFVYIESLYHYVHKKNEHLIPLLEKTLRELHAEDYWGDAASSGNPAPQARQGKCPDQRSRQ